MVNMLNFRKLRQDFSSNIIKEGKDLHDKKKVIATKILKLDNETIRFSGKVLGNFDNTYECEIEVDRFESQMIHSNCDCSYRYDCQHLAAMIFFLEAELETILLEYSKSAELEKDENFNEAQKEELLETIKEAETKRVAKEDKAYQREVLDEYVTSASFLSSSPFFRSFEENIREKAELSFLFNPKTLKEKKPVEFQLALRLPSRSKPLHIPFLKQFLHALRYEESLMIAGKRYFFSLGSFDEVGEKIASIVMEHTSYKEEKNDRSQRIAEIDWESFGILLAEVQKMASAKSLSRNFSSSEDLPALPSLFVGGLETPLHFSFTPAHFRFELEYLKPPTTKILMNPSVIIDQNVIPLEKAILLECPQPGVIFEGVYYRFPSHIKRIHLAQLGQIRELTIPEPLFGTFVENALPELKRFAEVSKTEHIEEFVTLPFVKDLQAKCLLTYLDGELEATLRFAYDKIEILASPAHLTYENIHSFVTSDGILARNLVEEQKIMEELFQDFVYNPETGTYLAKSEKKIVEFMTEVIPRNQHRVQFECPQNLLDQFIYDKTTFDLSLDYKEKVGYYSLNLKVDGALKGVKLDLLWECMASKRTFIELNPREKKGERSSPFSKILVLDLDRLGKIIQIFDEIDIKSLDNHTEEKPLWTLVNIDDKAFDGISIQFKMSEKLKEIRSQMLGETKFIPSLVPQEVKADLRHYQTDGVHWLERLRKMYLNGILADDMGLGKTLQAIVAITQYKKVEKKTPCLVVCPTTLLFNWQEEIHKFNSRLKTLVIDGVPQQRKKWIENISQYDVIITSYTLLQKDIELYKEILFGYAILDEAQHIKNRGTRNAKSVKMLQASHRLILTGTPIENSLEELWSLFDFLMPGFLSSFDRFVEKFIRVTGAEHQKSMEYLKKKISPFILRRMKADVLDDLPPVSEINYYCQLSSVQMELYRSYAQSARDELVKLVEKEGFEKVQIHVLATLTRLKQICCHPAIFAKEKAESGDSAKYEMLLELLQTLVDGGHKTVIFSQYTRMLQILREDFEQKGISFCYLDGTSKNRIEIVKDFNENPSIPIFLVSLKAGGTGLNITGADTVIHYDMWWNPAVENQATDRVHRIGQKKSVSAYKLITSSTIEEKILEMQKRKKGLVKKVVSCDDEVISKLTWEDVLELLQT
jgi:SNF2 family DNA or RNA helicase